MPLFKIVFFTRFVFIDPIIPHCEQRHKRKYLATDENYSHTNVNFLYHFIKQGTL